MTMTKGHMAKPHNQPLVHFHVFRDKRHVLFFGVEVFIVFLPQISGHAPCPEKTEKSDAQSRILPLPGPGVLLRIRRPPEKVN